MRDPVLAFFGEDDPPQPTERSATLYARYLERAGNDDVTIVVLEDVGNDIDLATPEYADRLRAWLEQL